MALLIAALGLTVLAGCDTDPDPSLGFPDDDASSSRAAGPGEHLPTTPTEIAPGSAPMEGATCTVRRVFAVPVSGEKVVLRGRVVDIAGRHTFVLDDGTGAITIHGDEDCGPFEMGDEVVVKGRVDVTESPFNVTIEAVEAGIE